MEDLMREPTARFYVIRLEGHLDERRIERFDGLTATLLPNGETHLSGPIVDQAALHGILNRIRDMGIPLIEVKCLEDPDA